ncbi:ribosome-associated translation inhibitor RaiA [Hoeflea sp. WL0058]|uniref:Ribosome hibernation promoting factor n=1 Tax=Flavimaribacter sediminis TaxID=2865987 RepID=A0AAE2ZKP6_9HYPH|nr:ribosome-associated translation inhibitor RaiA [Flavimaribacter sediminis]MBW8637961.1 ribosome-associated translation inhibitor RaiA [Flavimaribacter sediminis]
MTVRVSGKHMEVGDAFRTRIEDRIGDAVSKYFDGGYSSQVTIEKSGSRFSADCLIHLDTGTSLQATGQALEPQASFDAAAERLEKRLRRYKRRLKDHHAGNQQNGFEIAYRIMDSVPDDDNEVPEDYAPAIVAESSKVLKTMTVAGAVMALDMTDSPVLVFRNAANDGISVVYRRADGNIGWVDTADNG